MDPKLREAYDDALRKHAEKRAGTDELSLLRKTTAEQAAEIARLRAELEEAQTLLKQMRDALAPGESTTWNFLVNTLGVDFADDWHRDLRAANYELEEARALSAKLRDQFAMAIAGGELASQSRDWGGYLPGNEGQFAERVWKLTDAVLAARAGEEG